MEKMKPRPLVGVVKESETKRQALALLAVETPLEIVLTHMRTRGLSKVDSINLLIRHTKIPLQEAKEAVHASETWSDKFDPDETSHIKLEEAAKLAGFIVVPSVTGKDE
jgi:hypothetical protein